MSKYFNFFNQKALTLLVPDSQTIQQNDDNQKFQATIAGTAEIPLLGQSLMLNSKLDTTLCMYSTGDKVEVGNSTYNPPQGKTFVELKLKGCAKVKGKGMAISGSGLALSLSTEIGGAIEYRHLLSVNTKSSRKRDFSDLAETSNFPQLVKPQILKRGELHSFISNFDLNFGINSGISFSEDLEETLFGGINLPICASFKGALLASFGYGLQGKFEYLLERISPTIEDWVHLRMRKVRKSRVSLGVTITLQTKYDLGTGLVGLLEHTLNSEPVVALKKAIDKIFENSIYIDQVIAGQWTELEKTLEEKIVQSIQFLVSDQLNHTLSVVDGEKVKNILSTTRDLLIKYQKLEQDLESRLDGFWERILGYANLQSGSSFRQALTSIGKLKDIDSSEALNSLLSGDAKDTVDLLEQLTGISLEELLLSSIPDVKGKLERASFLAKKILAVIKETPIETLKQIQDFTKKTGISATIKWLSMNLPPNNDPKQLRERLKIEANSFIRQNIQNLLGKGKELEDIKPADLIALSELTKRIKHYLEEATKSVEQLKNQLMKLRNKVGFSLALEWERISNQTSIVDVEFKQGKLSAAIDALEDGQIVKFLKSLPIESNDGKPDYLLNQCILTDTKITTGGQNFFLSLIGKSKINNRQEVLSTRTMTRTRAEIERGIANMLKGVYRGKYARSISQNGEENIWMAYVDISASGSTTDGGVDAPYTKMKWSSGLGMLRNDSKTTDTELKSTRHMLKNLGFSVPHKRISITFNQESATRLAIKLILGSDALDVLLAPYDKEIWRIAYLNAAYHWFNTKLIKREKTYVGSTSASYIGPKLASFIAKGNYRDIFWDATKQRRREAFSNTTVYNHRKISSCKVFYYLPQAAKMAKKQFKKVSVEHPSLSGDTNWTHEQLQKTMEQFALACKDTMPWEGNLKLCWENPMFPVYQVLCLLATVQPQILKTIKGVATFRWADEEGNWQTPVTMSLEDGITLPQIVTI